MMSRFISSLFSRFKTSDIYELTTEQGTLRFRVHKDVLISQSEPFRKATITGSLEGTERRINLDDWDGETVGRLVEFLYTGDYKYPDLDPVSGEWRASDNSNQQHLINPKAIKKFGMPDLNRPLTPLKQCSNGFLPQDQSGHQSDEKGLGHFNPQDGYREALSAHAKIYSLAHFKSIEVLRTLALERLFMTLLKGQPIEPDHPMTPKPTELVTYTYSNTYSLVSPEEPLWKVIIQFAALDLKALQIRVDMGELMNEGEGFVNELVPKISRRLAGPTTSSDSEVGRKALVQPPVQPPRRTERNPIIGDFNTGEVHHFSQPWERTAKTKFFGTTYPAPPGLPVGINMMDIGKRANIRINTYTTDVGIDRFSIHIDSWLDTKIYSAGCMWLQIPNNDPDFQFGKFCTLEDHLHPQQLTSRLISFPRSYAEPPKVVVWLSGLDIQDNRTWRVRTYVTNITATNFIIHIDTWNDTILHSATATWVAYSADTPKVDSGTFNTTDVRPALPAQIRTSGHVNFGHNVFPATPHALLAFNELDIRNVQNLRIRVDYSDMTTAGMNWHISGWGNTIVFSAGVSYIALA